jgi:hypothetical protein
MHRDLDKMSRAMRPKLNTDHSRWACTSQQEGASCLSHKKAFWLPSPDPVCVTLERRRKINDDSTRDRPE